MTSWPPQKRVRKVGRKDLEKLYQLFVDNKIDLIKNDQAPQGADFGNERITLWFGPNNYVRVVFSPTGSPLSGASLERFNTVKRAMFEFTED